MSAVSLVVAKEGYVPGCFFAGAGTGQIVIPGRNRKMPGVLIFTIE